MRKALSIILLTISIASALCAAPTIGAGAAYRYDSVFLGSASLEAHIEDDSYAFGINSSFDKAIRISGRYTAIPRETVRLDVTASFYHAFPLRGGMTTLSFNAGQDLNFSGFALNYRAGIISGMNYSKYSDELHFSLSPNLRLEIGMDTDAFSLLFYLAGEAFYETSWQSVPIFGVKTEFGIKEHRLIFDSYIKMADYMEGPTFLISDVVFSLTYEVKI